MNSSVEIIGTPEHPQSLPDWIYGIVKDRILNCSLVPGQRLNEKAVADELRVSRTPLREALNRLAQERLLTRTPFSGYCVATLTESEVRDLCEVRILLETETAALAAERASSEDLESMQSCLELRYRPGDRQTYAAYIQSNNLFHTALARASHNNRLARMTIDILAELQRPLSLGLDVGLDPAEATEEHVEILKAVRARDSKLARKVHHKQLTDARDRMVQAMSRVDFDELAIRPR